MGLTDRHDRHQSVGAAWSASWCEAPVSSTEPHAHRLAALVIRLRERGPRELLSQGISAGVTARSQGRWITSGLPLRLLSPISSECPQAPYPPGALPPSCWRTSFLSARRSAGSSFLWVLPRIEEWLQQSTISPCNCSSLVSGILLVRERLTVRNPLKRTVTVTVRKARRRSSTNRLNTPPASSRARSRMRAVSSVSSSKLSCSPTDFRSHSFDTGSSEIPRTFW